MRRFRRPPERGLRPTVDVFSCALADAGEVAALLSGEDLARCARLRERDDRDRFATGRALLRASIGRRLAVPAADVTFSSVCVSCGASHGKPTAFVDRGGPTWHASVSHSGRWVAVAIADSPVGIDIEVHPDAAFAGLDDVAWSRSEQRALSEVPEPERRETRTRLWVQKEAYLKMRGVGLATPPSSVTLPVGREPTVTRDPLGPEQFVALCALAGREYRGCVALNSSKVPRIRFFDGQPVLADAALGG
jgi:4'-phosphopantetheinyl transferase